MLRKRLKVLIVDDEDDIRNLFERVLAGHGYDITTASGPVLARRAAHDAVFDILVTNIDMGGGAVGVQLAQDLLAANPRLHVVFMSGSPHEGQVPPCYRLLMKPFATEALLEALRIVPPWSEPESHRR